MRLIEPEGDIRIRIAALGDVGIIGSGRARAAREGANACFRVPAPALTAADLAFANLECPIGEAGWIRAGRSQEFFQDPSICAGLAAAGVRVVSLATNHMMDCGPQGLDGTLASCAKAGLATAGAGATLEAARQPALLESRGMKVAVLAYTQSTGDEAGPATPGVAPLEEALILEDLARWRPQVDLLVVSAHWGSMYVDYPPPRVTTLARALASAGADLVIGHHPHVLQGAERLGRTLVLYSLGDGAFNGRAGDFHAQVGAQARLDSGVFTALLASGAHGLDVAPHRLDDDGFPVAASAADSARILEHLRSISAGLAQAEERFAREAAPSLMQYQLEGLGHYVRQGRFDKILRLFFSIRPRHIPVIWQALVRSARPR
jgi:poly-gamma-glutamate synthesis protein (capsule biosynthesis protein)